MKLSAILAPLIEAKADHETIMGVVRAYEEDRFALIARFVPPGTRMRSRQWGKVRARIMERDKYTCAYCGDLADEVDHILPLARGGSNEDDNLTACCAFCNRSKGAKSLDEWVADA